MCLAFFKVFALLSISVFFSLSPDSPACVCSCVCVCLSLLSHLRPSKHPCMCFHLGASWVGDKLQPLLFFFVHEHSARPYFSPATLSPSPPTLFFFFVRFVFLLPSSCALGAFPFQFYISGRLVEFARGSEERKKRSVSSAKRDRKCTFTNPREPYAAPSSLSSLIRPHPITHARPRLRRTHTIGLRVVYSSLFLYSSILRFIFPFLVSSCTVDLVSTSSPTPLTFT